MTKAPASPLARSAATDVLDWDGVEPAPQAKPRDVFGLKPEDRQVLGLSAARTLDIAPTLGGDAHAALADILARGAALRKAEPRKKR